MGNEAVSGLTSSSSRLSNLSPVYLETQNCRILAPTAEGLIILIILKYRYRHRHLAVGCRGQEKYTRLPINLEVDRRRFNLSRFKEKDTSP